MHLKDIIFPKTSMQVGLGGMVAVKFTQCSALKTSS